MKLDLKYIKHYFRIIKNDSQKKYRYRWLSSLSKNYIFKKKEPWLVFDALDYINKINLKGLKVFEYGSGASSLFWLSRGSSLVSVEHNKDWYIKINRLITEKTLFDYRLIEPESKEIVVHDPSNPELYISEWLDGKVNFLKEYVTQIDEFEDNYFDIVLIDGRARPSCLKHSYLKVKAGGIIILDNAEREYYLMKTKEYLKNYQLISFYGAGPRCSYFWKTNIYKRLK